MIIIGLSGYASSGKSEAAKYLKEKYGFEVFEFSKEVEEEAEKLNLIKNSSSYEEAKRKLSEIGKIIRDFYGKEEIFAIKIVNKIKTSKAKKIVVDGFRSISEVKVFKNEFGKIFYLIFIVADEKLRYERRKLQDKNFSLSLEEFLERDKRDIEMLGLNKLEKIANFIIENNSSLEDFYKKLDLIVNSIIDEETTVSRKDEE